MNTLLTRRGYKLLLFASIFSFLFIQSTTLLAKNNSQPKTDSVVKILAIGNSFSEDAMEHFLYVLAKAGGHKVIIGNLFIGASDLDLHWKHASENNAKYNYRKIGVDGEKTKTPATAMSTVLIDENWDYISFQQVSNKSGVFETYVEPLPKLLAYVKGIVKNPDTKYIFHQTWAYKKDSKNKKFETYGYSQDRMYQAIAETSRKLKKQYNFDLLIPAGTAIQNARTSFVGDSINRDDFHLSLFLGRYTASCAWYEMIFKDSVLGNTYYPSEISACEAEMAQNAAHRAVKNPYRVSKLKRFKNEFLIEKRH